MSFVAWDQGSFYSHVHTCSLDRRVIPSFSILALRFLRCIAGVISSISHTQARFHQSCLHLRLVARLILTETSQVCIAAPDIREALLTGVQGCPGHLCFRDSRNSVVKFSHASLPTLCAAEQCKNASVGCLQLAFLMALLYIPNVAHARSLSPPLR